MSAGINSILIPSGFGTGTGSSLATSDLAGVSAHGVGQAASAGAFVSNTIATFAPIVAADVALTAPSAVASGTTPSDYQSRAQAALARAEPQAAPGGGGGSGGGGGITGLFGVM